MRRIAHGFWNPFGLLVRDDGEIFAAENDPGSRPPCRLLNIVEGADYGYQRAYGNAPIHPFVAWNGELRGTLGMIHPSSEAPCAIIELGGGVMIPSWSSHCIDYFPLIRKGAGYTSNRIELLRGSDFFRPVSMAPGPDGAFYLTDWVFSSYQLHACGRLWKLEIDTTNAPWIKAERDPLNEPARLANQLREGKASLTADELFKHARGNDPYLSDAALTALAHTSKSWTPGILKSMPAENCVWALVALRRVNLQEDKWVRAMINDAHPEIRFECLRWIADGVLKSFSSDVERILAQPDLDFRIFEAALATWNTLRGEPSAGVTDAQALVERVTNPSTPTRLKGYALRLAPALHSKFSVSLMRDLLASGDPTLSMEVVRTLAVRNQNDDWNLLAELARDESQSVALRTEAIAGLATSTIPAHQALLIELANHGQRSIRDESLRALRSRSFEETITQQLASISKRYPESQELVSAVLDPSSLANGRPRLDDTIGWLGRLSALPGTPDPEAGRRIFFHPMIGSCSNCHRYNGRGNVVGPDLSLISRQGDRAAILGSILEPDRELAPQFYTTLLELEDGNIFSGILLRSSNKDVFRDSTGKERTFEKTDIVQRKELKTSLMPTGLVTKLTDQELRDILAFLTASNTDAR